MLARALPAGEVDLFDYIAQSLISCFKHFHFFLDS